MSPGSPSTSGPTPTPEAALILHTADFHNRLPPAAARQLARLKQDHPGSVLLDAGDAVAAGNLTFRLFGEPILRRMASIGYDAMAMGNRESHPSRPFLERKLRDASFPILAANLNFSTSRYDGLKIYETGLVKEGVGAGGSTIAAIARSEGKITAHHMLDEIEKNYARLVSRR